MVEETLIQSHPRRIATFVGIGAVNTAIDISAFAFLYGLAGLDVVTSNVLAFLIAVINSYVLNCLITFADRRSRRGTLKSLARFLCVAAVAMGVSTAIVYLISMLTHLLIAKLIATVASTAINYLGCYRFVFFSGSGIGPRASEPSKYGAMDVKEQDILGDGIEKHWYYVAKGNALLQFLDGYSAREILDVGAGSGFFSKRLLCAGFCERATCIDTAYSVERAEMHCGKQIVYLRSTDRVTQDLILMMDVIEHVDDDVALIRAYTDYMPRGSMVLVTVPAFQFLWSGHDVFLEHKRRYTCASLHRTIAEAGLTVIRSRYFFSILLPVVCATRLGGRLRLTSAGFTPRSDLRVHSRWTNALLTAIHELERHTLFHINRLAGLTVFCLAKRR